MDYMNFNEQDLEQMFDELNKIVAILSFETNQRICILYIILLQKKSIKYFF